MMIQVMNLQFLNLHINKEIRVYKVTKKIFRIVLRYFFWDKYSHVPNCRGYDKQGEGVVLQDKYNKIEGAVISGMG